MKKNVTILVTLLLLLSGSHALMAAAKSVQPALQPGRSFVVGQMMVMMCDGPAYFCKPGDQTWHRVSVGQSIADNYSIRTAAHGYMILSWGPANHILLKPESAINVTLQPASPVPVLLQLYRADLMLAARDSGLVEAQGRHGTLMVQAGDCSIISSDEGETVRSIKGEAVFRLQGSAENIAIPESYYLTVDSQGKESPLARFDPQSEYESFRRFSTWVHAFDSLHRNNSSEVPFQIDSVKVNGEFISNLRQENGMHVLTTPDGRLPETILLQVKITPYPGPTHRFELSFGKDLVYAFREGRDDNFEVNFALPSFPEFTATINQVDSQERRLRVFSAGFTFHSRRAVEDQARRFCRELSDAMARRDTTRLRGAVSRDYRDWQGNTWFDFFNMADETLRNYRDVRLTLQPYRFESKDGLLLVSLNYRLSALTNTWNFRYEDRGTDVLTLKVEDGVLKLLSKVSGMFFNRLKVAVDLRQGILRGRVTDERTRRPLSGVSVSVRGTKYQTKTDSMGEYVIYNLPPGRYDLRFYKNGYGELIATTVTLKAAGEQF
ncbi:MAG TPA: carboxypeptidase-like regulatory domain-containing protein [Candidatus Rifleibacterium sp.]|nr:carboxypeptidase-like regulatory domain-containing protein [Candidatus Rifleibacterium sp.]HPT46497.1 carboxypeptidase-like regulatory domain-containing protein [Candidatus Rifleibacterium sp.]